MTAFSPISGSAGDTVLSTTSLAGHVRTTVYSLSFKLTVGTALVPVFVLILFLKKLNYLFGGQLVRPAIFLFPSFASDSEVHGNLTFKADFLVAHITNLVRELRIVNHVVSAIFRWTSNYIIATALVHSLLDVQFC